MWPAFGRLDARRGIVAVAIFAALVVAITSCSLPSKGPIPPQAYRPDGQIDASLVPDFVPALGGDGEVAGYVPKAYVIGSGGITHTRSARRPATRYRSGVERAITAYRIRIQGRDEWEAAARFSSA